ncbi:MAG: ABC transporter substrate-binding protein [Acidimicrobiales bacterium]
MKLIAALLALAFVAAACGSDSPVEDAVDAVEETTDSVVEEADDAMEDDADADADEDDAMEEEAAVVTITGPERDESEAGAIQEALTAFGEANNIDITYTGDADWEANIDVQVQGGNPPNLAIFPQPGKLADFAREGSVVPLADNVVAGMEWSEAWTSFGNVDGVQYGAPTKADLKSLVWYQPAAFEAAGYEVPTTFDEFTALTATMIADGNTPLCVGIESGQATGWTYTDWVEDMVLRMHGADVYDQWVAHEIPFDDPQIVDAMQAVLDLWGTEGMTFSSGGSIAATAFQDNGQPLVDGDCFMHRQASFYSAFMPEGTPFADGSDGAVDVFYFPAINGDRPVLGAGTLVAAFDENEATMMVAEYMAGAEYATTRQKAQTALKGGGLSGFLSAAEGQDESAYQALELSFLDILATAEVVRFDASDLMPAGVGAGTFWSEGTAAVNGDQDAAEAAAAIEASWP